MSLEVKVDLEDGIDAFLLLESEVPMRGGDEVELGERHALDEADGGAVPLVHQMLCRVRVWTGKVEWRVNYGNGSSPLSPH